MTDDSKPAKATGTDPSPTDSDSSGWGSKRTVGVAALVILAAITGAGLVYMTQSNSVDSSDSLDGSVAGEIESNVGEPTSLYLTYSGESVSAENTDELRVEVDGKETAIWAGDDPAHGIGSHESALVDLTTTDTLDDGTVMSVDITAEDDTVSAGDTVRVVWVPETGVGSEELYSITLPTDVSEVDSDVVTYRVDGEERQIRMAGNGTEASPYQISDAADLQYIAYDSDAHYEVVADINATETAEWNGGQGFESADEFSGSLDGNDHTIWGLTASDAGSSETVIIETLSGDVENLILDVSLDSEQSSVAPVGEMTRSASVTDVTITGTIGSEDAPRGAFGLTAENDGEIERVHVDADVTSDDRASGLVGSNGGDISDVQMSGTVTSLADEKSVSYGIARISSGTISDVVVDGTVESEYSATGVVGSSEGVVNDVSVTGNVVAESWQGMGVIGTNYGEVYDVEMSGDVDAMRSAGLVYVNLGSIEDVEMSGTVVGEERASGVVNSIQDGSVDRVSMSGTVEGNPAAGIAHDMANGEMAHVDVSGSISGDRDVVGVVAYVDDTEGDISVSNVIVTAEMSGGDVDPVGTSATVDRIDFSNVFWDREVVGESTTDTSVSNNNGVTTDELQDEDVNRSGGSSPLSGFPFDVAWTVTAGEYPELR